MLVASRRINEGRFILEGSFLNHLAKLWFFEPGCKNPGLTRLAGEALLSRSDCTRARKMPTVEMAGLSGNLLMQQDLQPYSGAGLARGFSNFRAKALSTEEILYGAALCMRGQNNVG